MHVDRKIHVNLLYQSLNNSFYALFYGNARNNGNPTIILYANRASHSPSANFSCQGNKIYERIKRF